MLTNDKFREKIKKEIIEQIQGKLEHISEKVKEYQLYGKCVRLLSTISSFLALKNTQGWVLKFTVLKGYFEYYVSIKTYI